LRHTFVSVLRMWATMLPERKAMYVCMYVCMFIHIFQSSNTINGEPVYAAALIGHVLFHGRTRTDRYVCNWPFFFDLRPALAKMARAFYQRPDRPNWFRFGQTAEAGCFSRRMTPISRA